MPPNQDKAPLIYQEADESLVTSLQDDYKYSVEDVFVLGLLLRKSLLTFSNQTCIVGEEFSSVRENDQSIFITDPYFYSETHDSNYILGLRDDVSKIAPSGSSIQRWSRPPRAIIVPLLCDAHWRVIVILCEERDNRVQIIFDDPFGASSLISCESFVSNISNAVEFSLNALKSQGSPNFTFTYHCKVLCQQNNGHDCGVIAVSNIRDYVKHLKEFGCSGLIDQITQDSSSFFEVPGIDQLHHSATIQKVRSEDKSNYGAYTNICGMGNETFASSIASYSQICSSKIPVKETKSAASASTKIGNLPIECEGAKKESSAAPIADNAVHEEQDLVSVSLITSCAVDQYEKTLSRLVSVNEALILLQYNSILYRWLVRRT
jgi:hypothetical protein